MKNTRSVLKAFIDKLMSWVGYAAFAFICTYPAGSALGLETSPTPVRLVLQITVDGLRGDLLTRYDQNFGPNGFNYLMDNGVVYTNAHYQHANTETIVGHTTLATGAHPSRHGMVGNVWYDRRTDELSYNIEDPKYPLLLTRQDHSGREQIDPTQKMSRTKGRSPSAILAPTFSDGLAAWHGGQSKIFAVSTKDRSAVSMAGHVGKAFWFSTDSGDFVTSTYYYDTYPDWVRKWNDKSLANDYTNKTWELMNPKPSYLLARQDDRPYEADLRGYGRVFPHPYGQPDDGLFYTRLVISPAGDRLVLDFSKMLIIQKQLGRDDIPDYLAISFSGVDAVNHFFGPSSLENEDIIVQLDRTLSDLFVFIDKNIGLQHTLIILSADHGMAEMPEYMTGLGFKAGRIKPEEIIHRANLTGKQFGLNEVARRFFRPYLYLDNQKIETDGLDQVEVERAVADSLSELPGISMAISKSRFSSVTNSDLLEQVKKNHNVLRSGDIYVIQRPYWFLFEKGPIVAMHGSPWRYDTHVPIIFAGINLHPQKVHRLVHPVDVAPTISALMGMTSPGSAQGMALVEVLDN